MTITRSFMPSPWPRGAGCERGPRPGPALHRDRSPVGLHRLPDDGEPQAGPGGLGCVERLEDLRTGLFVHARAVVLDLDEEVVPVAQAGEAEHAAAARLQGLDGVQPQVHEGLAEQLGIDPDLRGVGGVAQLDPDRGGLGGRSEHLHHLGEHRLHGLDLRLPRPGPREDQEALQQPGRADHLALHRLEVGPVRVVGGQLAQGHGVEAADHVERVPELVREPGGDAAQRGQPVGAQDLAGLLLDPLLQRRDEPLVLLPALLEPQRHAVHRLDEIGELPVGRDGQLHAGLLAEPLGGLHHLLERPGDPDRGSSSRARAPPRSRRPPRSRPPRPGGARRPPPPRASSRGRRRPPAPPPAGPGRSPRCPRGGAGAAGPRAARRRAGRCWAGRAPGRARSGRRRRPPAPRSGSPPRPGRRDRPAAPGAPARRAPPSPRARASRGAASARPRAPRRRRWRCPRGGGVPARAGGRARAPPPSPRWSRRPPGRR